MAEQASAEFEGKAALQIDQDPRSQQAGSDVEQHRKTKPGGENAQQAAIVLDHRFIHNELHVEGRRKHIGLQHQRQHQGLQQRRSQSTC